MKDLRECSTEELRKMLTPRQVRFAEAYIECGTATEAAEMAGYSQKNAYSQGSRLLKEAKVAAYLRARYIDLYDKAGVSPAWVGLKLKEVVERCLEGTPHLVWDSTAHAWVPDGTWQFDARGAVSALQAIGKSMGMFAEKPKAQGEGTNRGETIEELLERLEQGE